MMHEDSFENFDANEMDNDSGDQEDYDDPASKRRKNKKAKPSRKKGSELNPDDKPYSCDSNLRYKYTFRAYKFAIDALETGKKTIFIGHGYLK